MYLDTNYLTGLSQTSQASNLWQFNIDNNYLYGAAPAPFCRLRAGSNQQLFQVGGCTLNNRGSRVRCVLRSSPTAPACAGLGACVPATATTFQCSNCTGNSVATGVPASCPSPPAKPSPRHRPDPSAPSQALPPAKASPPPKKSPPPAKASPPPAKPSPPPQQAPSSQVKLLPPKKFCCMYFREALPPSWSLGSPCLRLSLLCCLILAMPVEWAIFIHCIVRSNFI